MDIHKTYQIAATPSEVWRALTETDSVERWGAGPAKMSADPGSPFSQWGGDIWGTVVEAEPPRRLVQEWYGGDWPQPSFATFTLTVEGSGTRVDLSHAGVPDDEAAAFDAGWDDYYFGPMKEMLETGARPLTQA